MAYIGQTPTAVALDGDDLANDIITLAKMASGTDGNIISYDASGNPVAIATGSDGQVLTSGGAGAPPAFEAASSYLHTVQTHVIVASSQSISANTITNITNLNATITPTAGTKILITVRWNGESSSTSMHEQLYGIHRDTTVIGNPDAASSRPVMMAQSASGYSDNGANAASTCDSVFYQYLDSPSTGSAITYHATIRQIRAVTLYNNRTVNDADDANCERLTSTITLQEVVAP